MRPFPSLKPPTTSRARTYPDAHVLDADADFSRGRQNVSQTGWYPGPCNTNQADLHGQVLKGQRHHSCIFPIRCLCLDFLWRLPGDVSECDNKAGLVAFEAKVPAYSGRLTVSVQPSSMVVPFKDPLRRRAAMARHIPLSQRVELSQCEIALILPD